MNSRPYARTNIPPIISISCAPVVFSSPLSGVTLLIITRFCGDVCVKLVAFGVVSADLASLGFEILC